MGLSALDAFYFVVTTTTTVGYDDITPRHAAPALRAYGCAVMLLGSATVATLHSIITDFVIVPRLEGLMHRGRPPAEGHTIVVGLGKVGYRVVEELRRLKQPVVGVQRSASGGS